VTIASIGSIGTNGTGSSATTIVLTTSAAAEAGNLVVVIVGKNNTATSSSETNEITGLADSGSNTWSKLGEYTYSEGAAADGGTAAIFFCRLTSTINSSGTITASFSASSGNRAIAAWEFSTPNTIAQFGTAQTTGANGTTNPGSLTASGLTTSLYLAVRVVYADASETLTVSSGYTELTGTNIGGGAALRGEFKIGLATSFTSAPTLSGVADSASVLAVIGEPLINRNGLFFNGAF
jgi:hypothetical protein